PGRIVTLGLLFEGREIDRPVGATFSSRVDEAATGWLEGAWSNVARMHGSDSHQIRSRAEWLYARLLPEARGLSGLEEGPRDAAERHYRDGESIGAARPRRRRVPDGH